MRPSRSARRRSSRCSRTWVRGRILGYWESGRVRVAPGSRVRPEHCPLHSHLNLSSAVPVLPNSISHHQSYILRTQRVLHGGRGDSA
jgi:hypothetical protein